MFTLNIIQNKNNIKAQYCAIANSGGKIDCESDEEYNITGKIEKNKIIGHFYSFFGSPKDKGKFEITINNNDSLNWIVTKSPQNDYYAPENVILKKED